MKLETLQERLAKAEEKIVKKQGTITKKKALIEKKKAKAEKETDARERRWIEMEIEDLKDDIKRIEGENEASRATVEKYKSQIAGEIEKERLITTEMPEVFNTLRTDLVAEWDRWDKEKRERLKGESSRLGYREFVEKYSYADYEFIFITDEQIHNANEREATNMILDLYNRVKDKTGEVTDWKDVKLTAGTWGFPTLNGVVIGKEGRARVESILAGGYNIQRLHVRVLVKDI